nr:hypothetical protein CFP56_74421 [Quercus suber]
MYPTRGCSKVERRAWDETLASLGSEVLINKANTAEAKFAWTPSGVVAYRYGWEDRRRSARQTNAARL